jgi:hypothetical protein
MRIITKHHCQGNSWWMKAAAKFATAGFTSVHSWAENALYTSTTGHTLKNSKVGLKADFLVNLFFKKKFFQASRERGGKKPAYDRFFSSH